MKIFKLKNGNKLDSDSIETHGKVWSTEDYTTEEKEKLSNPTNAIYFNDSKYTGNFYWYGSYNSSGTSYDMKTGRLLFSNLKNLTKVGFYHLNLYNAPSSIDAPTADIGHDVIFMIVVRFDGQIRQICFGTNGGVNIRRKLGSDEDFSNWVKL